jgi:hypothetical protein
LAAANPNNRQKKVAIYILWRACRIRSHGGAGDASRFFLIKEKNHES